MSSYRRAGLPAVILAVSTLCAPTASHAAGPVRVYPLGDSITYGATQNVGTPVGGTLVNTPGGYRGDLDLLLTANGVTHQFVGTRTDNSSPVLDATGQNHHDGWPGWRVEQVSANLDAGGCWITGLGARPAIFPDVVVIHLGTNDIGQRFDPSTTYPTGDGRANLADPAQRATFVSHLTDRLDVLVDKLQALRPSVRIVLSNVVPWATTSGTGAPAVVTSDYSAAVAGLAAAEQSAGENVVFADVWTPFVAATPNGPVVVPALLSGDNVHPTPAGYAVMATVYDGAVRAALAL